MRSLFHLILDFAESKFAECEGYARHDETRESISLGGSSLAQELRRDALSARPTDFEISPAHSRGDTL